MILHHKFGTLNLSPTSLSFNKMMFACVVNTQISFILIHGFTITNLFSFVQSYYTQLCKVVFIYTYNFALLLFVILMSTCNYGIIGDYCCAVHMFCTITCCAQSRFVPSLVVHSHMFCTITCCAVTCLITFVVPC